MRTMSVEDAHPLPDTGVPGADQWILKQQLNVVRKLKTELEDEIIKLQV